MKITLVGPCAPREFGYYLDSSSKSLPIGLVGVPVNELCRSLLRQGHYVHLVTASPDVQEVTHFTGDVLDLSVVPYRTRARDRAIDMFARERADLTEAAATQMSDVVHSHWTYEFAAPALELGRPSVVTAHDAPLSVMIQSPSAYRAFRTVLGYRTRRRIRHLTAVSPYLASKWRREMLYKRDIAVIPNIAPELVAGLGNVEDEPDCSLRILDIADDSPRKNVKALLSAFTEICRAVPSAQLVLIGAGLDDAGPIASWARDRGLSDGVKFVGLSSRRSVSQWLHRSHVFCHPSLEESQGVCLLEAMVAGVPVVGGRHSGGVAWTLGDGAAGALVDVSDPAQIAAGVLDVHRDGRMRRELLEEAAELISERYTAEAVGAAYVAEYEKVAGAEGVVS